MADIEARCMKCKKNVKVKDPKSVEIKKGTWAVKGVCPHCGTKVFRITGKNKAV
jgi:DNA-directed RNA polymerase subunit RPC12/RpoP